MKLQTAAERLMAKTFCETEGASHYSHTPKRKTNKRKEKKNMTVNGVGETAAWCQMWSIDLLNLKKNDINSK